MIALFDEDIKIAGSSPSQALRRKAESDASAQLAAAKQSGELERAHQLGKKLAQKLLTRDADVILGLEAHEDVANRVNLLAFTATVGFQKHCRNALVAASAYGAFYEEIKRCDPALYDALSDAGVFSFYYLAYRRGNDVERRMGQTYAMLCGMDGDPVHQELGEALYCHFSALVRDEIEKLKLE